MKFMFKRHKDLSSKIESLEREVYGPKEEKKSNSFWGLSLMGFYYGNHSYTLKQRVDGLQKILKKQEKLTHLILEHMKLEYVKVTEENGDTKTQELLRPIKPKQIEEKKKTGDCECCDYAN